MGMKTESPVFPSTTTSVSMQSPIQSSLSSPSQDHGYCSNTNDRQVLEKNLEKLISERGMDVIGQLTKEMSPQQIERLLVQTKQKLQGTNSVPLLQPALAVTPPEAGLQKRVVHLTSACHNNNNLGLGNPLRACPHPIL